MRLPKPLVKDQTCQRILDLRPDGIACIPRLVKSTFRKIEATVTPHVHRQCIEICLCLRGTLTFQTPEGDCPFLPGRIFVVTDRDPHCIANSPKGLSLYSTLFKVPARGRAILGLTVAETHWLLAALRKLPRTPFKAPPHVRTAFESIFAIYDNERTAPARAIRLKAAVLNLLLAVVEPSQRQTAKIPDRIVSVMARMREYPDRRYPIHTLAAEAGLSDSAFSELFKRASGLPPHAYLLSCKIERAKKMLTADRQTITAVAGLLQFASTQHFSTAFKHIVGKTPAQFIRVAVGDSP